MLVGLGLLYEEKLGDQHRNSERPFGLPIDSSLLTYEYDYRAQVKLAERRHSRQLTIMHCVAVQRGSCISKGSAVRIRIVRTPVLLELKPHMTSHWPTEHCRPQTVMPAPAQSRGLCRQLEALKLVSKIFALDSAQHITALVLTFRLNIPTSRPCRRPRPVQTHSLLSSSSSSTSIRLAEAAAASRG